MSTAQIAKNGPRTAGRTFPLSKVIPTAERPPVTCPESGVTLTGKGEAYVAAQGVESLMHVHVRVARGAHEPIVYFRLGTSPTFASAPDAPAVRRAVEDEIERLVDLLDAMDGDPDLEPFLAGFENSTDDREGGDVLDTGEPSLGWTEMEARLGCSPAPTYDCEQVDEDGDELDRGESDGLENGEGDPAEADGDLVIPGGNELGLAEFTRREARRLKSAGFPL